MLPYRAVYIFRLVHLYISTPTTPACFNEHYLQRPAEGPHWEQATGDPPNMELEVWDCCHRCEVMDWINHNHGADSIYAFGHRSHHHTLSSFNIDITPCSVYYRQWICAFTRILFRLIINPRLESLICQTLHWLISEKKYVFLSLCEHNFQRSHVWKFITASANDSWNCITPPSNLI